MAKRIMLPRLSSLQQVSDMLATDVARIIASYCDVKTLLAFGYTSKENYLLVCDSQNDNEIWEKLTKALMFDQHHEKIESLTWRQEYIHRLKFPVDHIMNWRQIAATDTFYALGSYKVVDIFSETLPACGVDVFYVLFSENSDVDTEFHLTRNDIDISRGKWEKATSGPGMIREITFVTPAYVPMGPKTTRVINKTRLINFKDSKSYLVQILTKTPDIPYGDTFCVQVTIMVTDNGDGTSQLVAQAGVIFMKSTLIKWKIEEAAEKEAARTWLDWCVLAKHAVSQAKLKQALFSDKTRVTSFSLPNAGAPESQEKKDKKRKHSHARTKSRSSSVIHPTHHESSIPELPTTKLTIHTPEPNSFFTNILSSSQIGFHAPIWWVIVIIFLVLFIIIWQPSIRTMESLRRAFILGNAYNEHQLLDKLR